MNYRPINNRNRRSSFTPLIIAFVIIGILFALHSIMFKSVHTVVQQGSVPIWETENATKGFLGNIWSYFRSKSYLADQNKKLTEQAELMRLEVLNTRTLQKENEELKKELGRDASTKNKILGIVLLKPSFSPYDTFVIDIGANVGLEVNESVSVSGVPIGKIAEVYPNSSLVRLYSSPGQEFQVSIGENNIEVLAKGMGGNNFFAVLPRETAIKEGDAISIPSITANTFAVVNKIEMQHNESFQKVFFRNPVSMQEVKWVLVEHSHE